MGAFLLLCNLTISLQATDAKLLFQQLSFPALEKHGGANARPILYAESLNVKNGGGHKMDPSYAKTVILSDFQPDPDHRRCRVVYLRHKKAKRQE